MILHYRTLCTLRLTHGYYGGVCPCFELMVPEESAREARRARLQYKMLDGILHVLYEADDRGTPRVAPPALRLRVGLKLVDAAFANVTEPHPAWAGSFAHYANAATPTALDAGTARVLTSSVLTHLLGSDQRPVTVRLRNEQGSTLDTQTVQLEHDRPATSFVLHGVVPGPLTVEEAYPSGDTIQSAYFLHPELRAAGVACVVDIDVSSNFYAAPPSFEIAFQARQQQLSYYLVVDNYGEGDFNALRVADGDEARGIEFTRIPVGSFTPDELPPALLASGETRLVLFRTNAPVARKKTGLRRLQLHRNGDVLIEHLPQPGEGRPDANLIIHISK